MESILSRVNSEKQLVMKKFQKGLIVKKPTQDIAGEQEPDAIVLAEVAYLNMGMSFGELALDVNCRNNKRKATVECIEECIFATLSAANYDKMLLKFEDKTFTETMDFLKSNPIYSMSSKNMLKQRPWILKKLYKGEKIITEGSDHKKFYIIRYGQIELTRKVKKVLKSKPLEIIRLQTEKNIVKDKTHEVPLPTG